MMWHLGAKKKEVRSRENMVKVSGGVVHEIIVYADTLGQYETTVMIKLYGLYAQAFGSESS